MNPGSTDDETWRVLVVAGLDPEKASNIRSFTLPDPRTGRPQGFLIANGQLLEINRFKQAFGAWLAGDRLLADGGMFLATPYDPLFVLLPILERGRDQDETCPAGKFKELDELLYDSAAPGLNELLSHNRTAAAAARSEAAAAANAAGTGDDAAAPASAPAPAPGAGCREQPAAETAGGLGSEAILVREPGAGERPSDAGEGEGWDGGDGKGAVQGGQEPQPVSACRQQRSPPAPPSLKDQLAHICDVRRVDEQCFYRLNDQRVLAWLLCKFKQMQVALAAQVAGMEAPYASSYVLSYMAEYVQDAWVSRVARHLGISEKLAAPGAATALQPTNGSAQAAAPPRPPPTSLAGPPEKKQKLDPRAAAKQVTLAKQAAGTKKLTSFFVKK